MTKYLAAAFVLCAFSIAHAQDLNQLTAEKFSEAPPEWCGSGGYSVDFSVGVECHEGEGCSLNYSVLDSLSKLRVDARHYQALNRETRVKADGTYLIDRRRRAHFFDSIGGYRGSKRANTEGNAYLRYRLTNERGPLSGVGEMWVMTWELGEEMFPTQQDFENQYQDSYEDFYREIDGTYAAFFGADNYGSSSTPAVDSNSGVYVKSARCARMPVRLQEAPFVSGELRRSTSADVYYDVDRNSKAGVEGANSLIRVYARTEFGNEFVLVGSRSVSNLSGTVNIPMSGYRIDQGEVRFFAEVSDGVHLSNRVAIGTYTKSCPTGHSWVFQPSPGNASPTINQCGVDSHGNQCPFSVAPTRGGSYPPLRYTCR